MKKFLFILSYTLVSSLFSTNIFKEELSKAIVIDFVNNDLLENVTTKINSLQCLKYLAENYLELLKQTQSYEDAFIKLNKYLTENDIGKLFCLNNSDKIYASQILQEQMKTWLELVDGTLLNNPEASINSIEKAKILSNMSLEEEVKYFDKENTEMVTIFMQALIKICDEKLRIPQPAAVSEHSEDNNIMSGIVVLGAALSAMAFAKNMLSGGDAVNIASALDNIRGEDIGRFAGIVVGIIYGAVEGDWVSAIGGGIMGTVAADIGGVIGERLS